MKKINLLLIIYFFLVSCGSLSNAGKVLRNEKIKTTDEFLVKKKEPLVLPPDYNKIPEPGSISKNTEEEQDKIKKILRAPKKSINSNASSTEESIINRIRK
jgi:hypothetical protein